MCECDGKKLCGYHLRERAQRRRYAEQIPCPQCRAAVLAKLDEEGIA